jgi:RHS repeat-associated protein
LVAEYDESGNLVAKYHHDGGGLMAMTRSNESYWYGFEAIGTVRQLMGSQGQVVDAYAFDAWGNEITNPQSQVQNPFKYVGKHGYYWDTESALMLLGVRYYAPSSGLFLSRDIMEGYGYTYAVNNPARWIDPKGLQTGVAECEVAEIVTQSGLQCLKLICRVGAGLCGLLLTLINCTTLGDMERVKKDPKTVIQNKDCLDYCDNKLEDKKDKECCKRICKERNRNTCGALEGFCRHLGRKNDRCTNVCWLMWEHFCTEIKVYPKSSL